MLRRGRRGVCAQLRPQGGAVIYHKGIITIILSKAKTKTIFTNLFKVATYLLNLSVNFLVGNNITMRNLPRGNCNIEISILANRTSVSTGKMETNVAWVAARS